MSRLSLRIAAVTTLSAVAALCTTAQIISAQANHAQPPDRFQAIKEFLAAEYPEASASLTRLSVTQSGAFRPAGLMTSLVVTVAKASDCGPAGIVAGSEPAKQCDGTPKENDDSPLLRGAFDFRTRDNVMLGVSIDCRGQREVYRMTIFLASHSDWSDEQVVKALRDAGARFLPPGNSPISDKSRLRSLEQFFGPLTLKSVKFVVRDPNASDGADQPYFDLEWNAVIEAKQAHGPARVYWATFEPFEGRLTAIHPN